MLMSKDCIIKALNEIAECQDLISKKIMTQNLVSKIDAKECGKIVCLLKMALGRITEFLDDDLEGAVAHYAGAVDADPANERAVFLAGDAYDRCAAIKREQSLH